MPVGLVVVIIVYMLFFIIISNSALVCLLFFNGVYLGKSSWAHKLLGVLSVKHIVWGAVWAQHLVALMEWGCKIGLLLLLIDCWGLFRALRDRMLQHHILRIIAVLQGDPVMSSGRTFSSCIHIEPGLSIWSQMVEFLDALVWLPGETNTAIGFAAWYLLLITVSCAWNTLPLSAWTTSRDCSCPLTLWILGTSSNWLGVDRYIFLCWMPAFHIFNEFIILIWSAK